jgi:hypothetical protein
MTAYDDTYAQWRKDPQGFGRAASSAIEWDRQPDAAIYRTTSEPGLVSGRAAERLIQRGRSPHARRSRENRPRSSTTARSPTRCASPPTPKFATRSRRLPGALAGEGAPAGTGSSSTCPLGRDRDARVRAWGPSTRACSAGSAPTSSPSACRTREHGSSWCFGRGAGCRVRRGQRGGRLVEVRAWRCLRGRERDVPRRVVGPPGLWRSDV